MPNCVLSTFQNKLQQWASNPTTSYELDAVLGKHQHNAIRSPGSIISPHADSTLQSGLSAFFPFSWDNPELSYQDKNTADWVVRELMKKNIQVRSIGFANNGSSDQGSGTAYAIRVSTAYFNSADEIDRFSIALQEVLKKLP